MVYQVILISCSNFEQLHHHIMSNLIDVQPTDISRQFDSFIFYYGVKKHLIYQLEPNAEFSVVYSPVEQQGWEVVRYQVLEELNGVIVLERRSLDTDEIAYFERLANI